MIETDSINLGHALNLLKEMQDGMADCVITSPPYWGLRDYGLEPIVWDAKESCEHVWKSGIKKGITGGKDNPFADKLKIKGNDNYQETPDSEYAFCSLCGAWRGSLGLEPTFQLYLDHLMQIMAECKRVMKDTGTMWVNIGDSYNSHSVSKEWAESAPKKKLADSSLRSGGRNSQYLAIAARGNLKGYPDKCLIGIPERFAIRMTDELGMIRRNTIIWYKRNCMPSSAKDRFTVDFEPVYFFTKQGDYWFKQQREPHQRLWNENIGGSLGGGNKEHKLYGKMRKAYKNPSLPHPEGRNMRCVWNIPTQSNPELHFATFPQALVEPMLSAGCPPDGIVLDPFAGMCTVASVAIRQAKHFIMIEASPEYAARAKKRINLELQQTQLKFYPE